MSARKKTAAPKPSLPTALFVVHPGQLVGEEPGFSEAGDAVAHAESLALDEGATWWVAQYKLVDPSAHVATPKKKGKR